MQESLLVGEAGQNRSFGATTCILILSVVHLHRWWGNFILRLPPLSLLLNLKTAFER
jgi:hypothetical protein